MADDWRKEYEEYQDWIKASVAAIDRKGIMQQMDNIVDCLANEKEPPRIPEEFRSGGLAMHDIDLLMESMQYRTIVTQRYWMWAYLSAEFLDQFANVLSGKRILDPFAGYGWLAKGLRNRGLTVTASDVFPGSNLTEIEPEDALLSIKKHLNEFDTLILSWVPAEKIDYQILAFMRKNAPEKQIIWIGEINGASGTKRFSREVEFVEDPEIEQLNQYYDSWLEVKDAIYSIK